VYPLVLAWEASPMLCTWLWFLAEHLWTQKRLPGGLLLCSLWYAVPPVSPGLLALLIMRKYWILWNILSAAIELSSSFCPFYIYIALLIDF
jgi:hypothetical protein